MTANVPDPERIRRLLRRTFRIKSLRDGQEQVIQRVLKGLATLAVMPTGAGKSLCYQLPAMLMPGRTVVVSPLIALMKDQCDALQERGVRAAPWHSGLAAAEAQAAEASIADGSARIVFVTPERLGDPQALELLARHPVSLLVVDEAHCLSQWGFDFRPAYLQIGDLVERLGRPAVLALTATATREVVDDVTTLLSIPRAGVIGTDLYRPNLRYAAEPFSRAEDKLARLLALVQQTPGQGLVYAASIRSAEMLHDALHRDGVTAGLYHGRLPARRRNEVQDDFMEGRTRVMVATNAFGLGVDKPDIRFVVHFEIPGDLAAYCQETGRAGRDGEEAACTLLYVSGDRNVQQFFLGGRYPELPDFRRLVDALRKARDGLREEELLAEGGRRKRSEVALHLLREAGVLRHEAPDRWRLNTGAEVDRGLGSLAETCAARAERDRAGLEAMTAYAQTGRCRWRLLLEHLEGRPSDMQCGRCDNCLRLAAHLREEAARADTAEPIVVPSLTFRVGDRVRTRRHGQAEVIASDALSVTVRFGNGETRCFQPEFVAPVRVRSRRPRPPAPATAAAPRTAAAG